ncbi:MAG: MFS transporter [Tunicatimonas sp.]|uniref:MFS transporter n=1 Tax=Tunicatimonas sp. TaxID=1940096 RepID=UPI003C76F99C
MFSLSPKNQLTEAEQTQGLRWVLRDGVAAQTMITLTGGAFLVAYALQLGASHAHIGLLAAVPTLANILQLVSIRLIERFRSRRKIIVSALFVGRAGLFVIALIPFLNSDYAIFWLIAATILLQSCAAIATGCWSSWMRDLIPTQKLGTFFSHRLRLSQLVGAILSLLIAFAIDYVKRTHPAQEIYAYALLFLLGGLVGYVGVFFLYKTPEPRPIVNRIDFGAMIRLPFQHRPFRNLIWYSGLWNFATNLAAPFFTVYLLQRLNYGISTVIILTVLSQVAMVVSLTLWGKYADRYSYKAILSICAPLYLIGLVAWTFTTLPDPHAFTLPLLILIHLLMGFATGGTSLAASSIGLKVAPQEQSAVYLAVISMSNALTAGIAPIVGGILADFFVHQELSLSLNWSDETSSVAIQAINFQQLDFFFIFASLLGVLALYRLGFIREDGDVDEKIVLREIRWEISQEMKNLSSIVGTRSIVKLPFSLFQNIRSRTQRRA